MTEKNASDIMTIEPNIGRHMINNNTPLLPNVNLDYIENDFCYQVNLKLADDLLKKIISKKCINFKSVCFGTYCHWRYVQNSWNYYEPAKYFDFEVSEVWAIISEKNDEPYGFNTADELFDFCEDRFTPEEFLKLCQ